MALLRYLADPLSDLRAAALLRSRIVRLSDARVARLAPDARRRDPQRRSAGCSRRSADEDRRVLERLRARRAALAVVGRSADAVGAARRGARAKPRTRTSCAGRAAARRART